MQLDKKDTRKASDNISVGSLDSPQRKNSGISQTETPTSHRLTDEPVHKSPLASKFKNLSVIDEKSESNLNSTETLSKNPNIQITTKDGNVSNLGLSTAIIHESYFPDECSDFSGRLTPTINLKKIEVASVSEYDAKDESSA